MATADAHIKQYEHNRAFIPLVPTDYRDWIITASFYCCVHLIDAVLAQLNSYHPVDHKTRNRAIANIKQLEFIARKYDPLYQLCRKVRYFADPNGWVTKQNLEAEVFGQYLYPLEVSAFRLLKIEHEHKYIELKP